MALVKYNNNSISGITSAASVASGAITHIKTLTASSSSTLSFVDGSSDVVLDNTYPIYRFTFIDIHPATNDVNFQFNMSVDSGSNYNVAKTTIFFRGYHTEAGSGSLEYDTGRDAAQSTGNVSITREIGNQNDESTSGNLFLFNPSSTNSVKHYISRFQDHSHADAAVDSYSGGYGNTTSAVDAIRFSFSSGNIDSGTIKLYGIKNS